MSVESELAEFVRAELGLRRTIAHGEDLIETDLLDSAGIVGLIAFLGDRFGVAVDEDTDLLPENFRTVDAVAAFVRRKQSAHGRGTG